MAMARENRMCSLPSSSCLRSPPATMMKQQLGGMVCVGCGDLIFDRFLLQVNQETWHAHCLRCSVCSLSLDQLPSCYFKEEKVFCKMCYQSGSTIAHCILLCPCIYCTQCRKGMEELLKHIVSLIICVQQFGVKCDRCNQTIQSNHWVRRARQYVYHLACFACDTCQRQLSTGEEFALQDSRVLCKQHYMELLDGDGGKMHHKQKTKRVRTTFTEEQLQILQANFQVDSNPDGQDLERIAQVTGLSKRVTQVWFQNSRARQKKCQGVKVKSVNPRNSSSRDSYEESSPSGPLSEPVTTRSARSSSSPDEFTDLHYVTDLPGSETTIETGYRLNTLFDRAGSVPPSTDSSPC
ncbi:hypothetical protein M514_26052 [Trichuris suis]|uniref:LIM domain protein n=1 Tax=Trichuris suis TaxID=68888 RepID=A0A085MX10_9BILA|nr:hypothetical protein M514_26052 [Trichuris suis]